MEEEKRTDWKKIIIGVFYIIRILILVGLLIGIIFIMKKYDMNIFKNIEQKQENEKNIIEQANGNPVINNVSFEFIGYETKTRKN